MSSKEVDPGPRPPSVEGVRAVLSGGRWKYQPQHKGKAIAGELFDTQELGIAYKRAWLERNATEHPVGTRGVRPVCTLRMFIYDEVLGQDAKDNPIYGFIKNRQVERDRALKEDPPRFVYKNLDADVSVLNTHVQPMDLIIDTPLHKINSKHVEAELRALRDKESVDVTVYGRAGGQLRVVHRPTGRKLGRKTIANVEGLLHVIFGRALHEKLITRMTENPVPREARNPKGVTLTKDVEYDYWTYLTLDQVDQLVRFLAYDDNIKPTKNPKLKLRALRKRAQQAKVRAYYICGIYQGPRRGELLGLRRRDVMLGPEPGSAEWNVARLAKGKRLGDSVAVVNICRSFDGPPKTAKGIRALLLFPPAREALRAHLEEQADLMKASGHIPHPDDLVFPSPHGWRTHYSESYDMGWRDKKETDRKTGALVVKPGIRSRAGLPEHITSHMAMRHTNASMMAMGAWVEPMALEDLQDWLGHGDVKTTQRYKHLVPSMLQQKMAKVYAFPKAQIAVGDEEDE